MCNQFIIERSVNLRTQDSTEQSGSSSSSGMRAKGSMSLDSCCSSCPCGGVFVAGQNHDTGRLSAWHRVPRVMHYQIHDCFLSCTSTLLQNILFQATIRNELQIAVNGITTTPWVRESAQPQKNSPIIRQGMQKNNTNTADKKIAVLPTSHIITAKLTFQSNAIITGRT